MFTIHLHLLDAHAWMFSRKKKEKNTSIALRLECSAASCGNDQLPNWSELDRVMSARAACKPRPFHALWIPMKSCLQRKDFLTALPAFNTLLSFFFFKLLLFHAGFREILRTAFLQWFLMMSTSSLQVVMVMRHHSSSFNPVFLI